MGAAHLQSKNRKIDSAVLCTNVHLLTKKWVLLWEIVYMTSLKMMNDEGRFKKKFDCSIEPNIFLDSSYFHYIISGGRAGWFIEENKTGDVSWFCGLSVDRFVQILAANSSGDHCVSLHTSRQHASHCCTRYYICINTHRNLLGLDALLKWLRGGTRWTRGGGMI